MVLAHVAVRQHVVAELLRVAQPRAVAEHHPGVRPQHRDVVGDRLGVGRADADVDHRDAAAVGADEVVGRHLRQARRRSAELVAGPRRCARAPLDHVAGLDERFVVAAARRARHRFVAEADELVDVELVVGEEDEVLEVLGVGAGVVAQAMQRVVDARRGEERERMRFAGARDVGAVGDAVVHRAEVGQVEQVAQQQAPLRRQAALDVVVLGEREVDRDRLHARADLERDAVVLEQEPELLAVVAGEQVGAGERRLVGARAGDEAVAEARVGARDGVGVDANERIAGAHAARGRRAVDERLQGDAQVVDAGVVDLAHARERRVGVVEERRGDEGRNEAHAASAK